MPLAVGSSVTVGASFREPSGYAASALPMGVSVQLYPSLPKAQV